MTTNGPPASDDTGQAAREGRPPRTTSGYRIQYAEGNLDFRPVDVTDPVPLGRQILDSAGANPRDGYSLFAILPTGDFEDVRLDEPFDLRGHGAERFVAFQTDREFKLTLDDRQLAWGKPAIGGSALYALADVGKGRAVFLKVQGGEDRLIEPEEIIDLTAPVIERFVTGPKPPPTFEIIVNARPRIVADCHVTFGQVVQLAFPGSTEPNVVFSVTYRHAASLPHAGELGAGGSVEVKKKGTIFNVTKTIQS